MAQSSTKQSGAGSGVPRILLIGPYPPPHGGVSVHVAESCRLLRESGYECRVLNIDRNAPPSDKYIRIDGAASLVRQLIRHARQGWTFHVHTNGHNDKSWLVALICGLIARTAGSLARQRGHAEPAPAGPSRLLTLHSGMAPDYLRHNSRVKRIVARLAARCYDRIVAVSPAVRDAVLSLGVPHERVVVEPAFLLTSPAPDAGSGALDWLERHSPRLATALFFRPEYGLEILIEGIERLRNRYPHIGCVVMGSGDEQEKAVRDIERRGLRDCFLLAGNLEHPECLAVMARSDAFVRPTLADGDAVSVREALALGVPVVASDVGMRPAGTVLFCAGNATDLAARLNDVVAAECAAARQTRPPCTTDHSVARLLGLYSLSHAEH